MKIQMKLYSAKSSRRPVHEASGEVANHAVESLIDGKGIFKATLVDADPKIFEAIENASSGEVKGFSFVLGEMAKVGTGAPIWKGCRESARVEILAI